MGFFREIVCRASLSKINGQAVELLRTYPAFGGSAPIRFNGSLSTNEQETPNLLPAYWFPTLTEKKSGKSPLVTLGLAGRD